MISVFLLMAVSLREITVPSCFNLVNGETLFEETFNGSLHAWQLDTGTGDTPGTETWKQVFANDALEGSGYIEVQGLDGRSCIPKVKIFLSPSINITGWQNLSVSFFRRFTQRTISSKDAGIEAWAISGDESIPLDVRLENGRNLSQPLSMLPSKGREDWNYFGRGLSRQEITGLGGSLRLALVYTSVSQSCDDLAIDLVSVRGYPYSAPDTIITQPALSGESIAVPTGELIPFGAISAAGNSNVENKFLWRVFDLSLGLEVDSFSGSLGAYRFESPGTYIVTCTAYDEQCNVDPTPDQRVIVASDPANVDTEIVEPQGREITITLGKTVPFKADVTPNGTYDFFWTVTSENAAQTSQEYPGQQVFINFPEVGRYLVSVFARRSDGAEDATPDRILVNVVQSIVEIYSPQAQNDRGELVIPGNLRVLFRGTVDDPRNTITDFYWMLNPGEKILCENEKDCAIIFNEAGTFTVALIAKSGERIVGLDFLKIIVNPELRARITQPTRDVEIPINTPISLASEITGAAANQAQVAWTASGNLISGSAVQIPGIANPGRYQVRLLARNPATNFVATDAVDILIYDPDNEALPQIISPKTDVIVKPGMSVFFDSALRNAREVNRRPYWEVRKMSTQEVLRTSSNATLGRVEFSEAGVFEVGFFLRGQNGNQFLEKRVVTVKTGNPAAFNSNGTLNSAAEMTAGDYYPLNLDREHFYTIQIPADGLSLAAKIQTDGPARLLLLDSEKRFVGSREVPSGVNTMQLQRLPAGTYFLVVSPIENAPKRMVSFSLSLDVLNPALYFTDVSENQLAFTLIGAVNPTNAAADVELIAYDKEGVILAKQDTFIEAGGIKRYRILELFPNIAGQIAWIRVDSTRDLVGFSQVTDIALTKSYAFSAAKKLSSELFAPHIAQDLVNWSTSASIVNGIAEESTSFLLSGQTPRELNNQKSYAQDSFNFLDKFDGALPPNVEWGWFQEDSGKNSLAGNEVFSRLGGFSQTVSLGLVEAPAANPNFVQQGNTFYFTHIARDVVNFWTGIALVNIEDTQQSARIRAFGPEGVFVGEKTITLEPAEKQVSLAEIFLDGIGSPENVDWVEIIGDPGVVGYEIFGTWNNKQLAGLEAITEGKTEICFPYVDNTGSQWHGFAAVNISDEQADVQFMLINDAGGVLKTVERSLAPRAKQIFLLDELFSGIPFNAGWVKAVATQPIAGFELFGTDETMAGIIAQ